MSTLRPLLGCVLLALLAGCNRYGTRVPDEVLQKLPYESRIELLEAENELALAIDHRDEAHSEMLRTRDSLRRANSRLSAANQEVRSAEDAASREVAQLTVVEAEARVAYLRARQEVNRRREELMELSLQCARAQFELSRLNVARKAKVPGSEAVTPQHFEEQLKACRAHVAEDGRRVEAEEKNAQGAKNAWEQRRTELARKTFDARASPYVE